MHCLFELLPVRAAPHKTAQTQNNLHLVEVHSSKNQPQCLESHPCMHPVEGNRPKTARMSIHLGISSFLAYLFFSFSKFYTQNLDLKILGLVYWCLVLIWCLSLWYCSNSGQNPSSSGFSPFAFVGISCSCHP